MSSAMKIGYKVTTHHGRSPFAFYREAVEYGRFWAQPSAGCGPLFVFDSLENAAAFALLSMEIHRCWYTPSTAPIDCGWDSDGLPMPLVCAPKGTVLADAVYLIEEVTL